MSKTAILFCLINIRNTDKKATKIFIEMHENTNQVQT
jgi:hypothetical protein